MVRYAAENHLMINIHDEYRPSGFSRTYPNLLTQEGIRGNEEFPDATHNTVLPFTRMINGPADYTICYYDRRLKNTHGHQLAASLVYYSPLTTLFWYDKPETANDEPELRWFDNLKTAWDETRVLDGAPGSHIVIARRSGEEWYVAAMTNTEARMVTIPTDLLAEGKRYTVTIFNDDPAVNTRTKVSVKTITIKAGKSITLQLQPCGGATMHFTLSH
jgi:alpha-glucosidase